MLDGDGKLTLVPVPGHMSPELAQALERTKARFGEALDRMSGERNHENCEFCYPPNG